MTYGLTPRQKEALSFIGGFQLNHGYSPNFEEIRVGLSISSKSGVHRLVHALHERGAIRFMPGKARTIEIVEKGSHR